MKLINQNRPFPTEFFRFFDDHRTRSREHGSYRPSVNIIENDDAFELALLAPGRDKDLFNLAFNDGVLEITYTANKEVEETTPTFRRREFQLADFTRRFTLDDTVIDDTAIKAAYENGVLLLTLPKREEALPKEPRQIAVG